ncbi:MAG: heme o synthase [Chloroflexota bacterium]
MKIKIKNYWPLIKSLQTALLLITGIAGYMSVRCPVLNLQVIISLSGSLFLAISGSTVLNMWYDRDIDARMERTCLRPLPTGQVSPKQALSLGLLLSIVGVGWALLLDPLFGLVVFAGLFIDVVIYTIWLKRVTAWSIVWGGISGGMPVLAGRALALGYIDWIGVALSLAVLFWIPTHILTFNMRYHQDYKAAGVPTFPSRYGFDATRKIIALSSILAVLLMGSVVLGVGISGGFLHLFGIVSFILVMLAVTMMTRPSTNGNFGLFKYASMYMLGAMVILIFNSL